MLDYYHLLLGDLLHRKNVLWVNSTCRVVPVLEGGPPGSQRLALPSGGWRVKSIQTQTSPTHSLTTINSTGKIQGLVGTSPKLGDSTKNE